VETYAAELPLADDLALILISGSPVSQPAHPVWPFVCPGQIGALRPVYAEALKWMFEHARSWAQRQEMEEFLFAVWEVMKNQVSHALQGEADLILGRLAITPDYFEAHLYDRGRAFSEPPLAGKAPTADSSVEGGYGFLIVKGILDDCHYERQAHGRNHWRLEKLRREG
jgi:anti-sigma regulatory factor (Ser/Thr protein kinase)